MQGVLAPDEDACRLRYTSLWMCRRPRSEHTWRAALDTLLEVKLPGDTGDLRREVGGMVVQGDRSILEVPQHVLDQVRQIVPLERFRNAEKGAMVDAVEP